MWNLQFFETSESEDNDTDGRLQRQTKKQHSENVVVRVAKTRLIEINDSNNPK